jgi:hypothetical protein
MVVGKLLVFESTLHHDLTTITLLLLAIFIVLVIDAMRRP